MKFSKEEIQNSMLLYAVTDRMWLKDGEGLTDVCRKVLENGATFLQIREKDLDENTFEQEAEALKELCASYRVPYVVNDSVEIAMDIDADGVHVGQSDIKGRDIRAMIGVGAVFGTSTKKNARNLSLEKLQEISSSVSIPVVAIGGINASNLMELAGSGVDGVAVVSAIFAAKDPGQATRELKVLAQKMVEHE